MVYQNSFPLPSNIKNGYDFMSNEFWQYAVGGLGVALVGVFGAFLKGWFSRADNVDKLQFEQLKFLLEESRKDVISLKEENEKLREEVQMYSTQIGELTGEIKALKAKLED